MQVNKNLIKALQDSVAHWEDISNKLEDVVSCSWIRCPTMTVKIVNSRKEKILIRFGGDVCPMCKYRASSYCKGCYLLDICSSSYRDFTSSVRFKNKIAMLRNAKKVLQDIEDVLKGVLNASGIS